MALRAPPAETLADWLPFIRVFLQRLQVAFIGVSAATATSWFRDARENLQVGGDQESQHLFGIGLDVAVPVPQELHALARRARSLGLTVEENPTFLHFQLFPRGALRRAGVRFPTVA